MMFEIRWSSHKSILVVPVLAVAGLLSSIFALPFRFLFTSGDQNRYLFLSLESLLP
jgi:hypothetical protein